MFNRIKRIRSHSGHARFLAECKQEGNDHELGVETVGFVPQQPDIASPYRYSPYWAVYEWSGKKIVLRETSHRCFDVYEVPAAFPILAQEPV